MTRGRWLESLLREAFSQKSALQLYDKGYSEIWFSPKACSQMEVIQGESASEGNSAPESNSASGRNSAPEESGTMRYSNAVMQRAQRAVRCSPFYLKLLADMRDRSVSVPTIAENSGAIKGYTQQPLSDVATERELMWLSSVGILRREVDGQGLTDSFRLTPLGRQIVERWQAGDHAEKRANLIESAQNAAVRWLRLPDWLL